MGYAADIKKMGAISTGIIKFGAHFRGVAQPGSVLRSGRRGRWFESSRPDKNESGETEHEAVSPFFCSRGLARVGSEYISLSF